MSRVFLWSLLAVSLAANATIAVLALRAPSAQGLPSSVIAPRSPCLLAQVALEPGQRAQVAEIRKRFLAHREAHARRTGEMRERLARLLVQESPEWERIDQEISEISRAQGSLQRAIVEHVLAVRSLLHGEQRLAFTRNLGELVRSGRALPADCARPGLPRPLSR
jgi:hypothetical protein